jgi:urea transport system substrate-binding protein
VTIDRRQFLSSAAALVSASTIATPAFAADPIKVGSLHDLSGGLDIYGKPMVDALTFAIEEANAAGGLLSRQLQLVNYDTQSSMQLYTQFAQQAALKDKVAVVHGGITSASREVIRPVLDKFKTLYFYNTQYEGGVCDRNQFDTGVTPAQTVEKLVPYSMKKWGKKVYVIAADYNYGQITSQWVKKYTTDNGGEVLSIDFFPLDVTNFSSTISKIQAAKPDFVWSALVGGAHISFYRQWAAAGMNKSIPMASTTFGVGNEQIVLSPDEATGMLVCYNYFEGVKNPANAAFLDAFHKRFGADYPNVTELAMGTYQGFKLWAEGVKKAESIDRMKVIEALETPNQHRRAFGKGDDRSSDASLYSRRSHRRGEGQEVRVAGRLLAAEAGGHGGSLRPQEEPERQPAICDQDLSTVHKLSTQPLSWIS